MTSWFFNSLGNSADFTPAFSAALVGTLRVFGMGLAGWFLFKRGFINPEGLKAMSQLVALLTLPCLIFGRFARSFDPQTFPSWWLWVLLGALVTGAGLVVGRLVSLRHDDNNEATLLVGFQNAGFWVLPMLQALVPPQEFGRASLLLFVFIVPFNASLWLAGSYFLLGRPLSNLKIILTPTFVSTLGSLALWGLFHDPLHQLENTLLWSTLLGDERGPGALVLIGDLTVPLATLALGGSIANNLQGAPKQWSFKRAVIEVALVKMLFFPLLGFFVLRAFYPSVSSGGDAVVWTLMMLQLSAPPAINTAVFAQQNGYSMRLIPAACLVCYAVALVFVPFWCALALK